MLKNIVLILYVIIVGIAIGTSIISGHITETGIIEFGKTAFVEVGSNELEPETVKGDLVIIDTSDKSVKKKDIISYITIEQGQTRIRTNKIVAVTKDSTGAKIYSLRSSTGAKIYSLRREDGTIENIDDSCILGTYQATIPFAGTAVSYVLTRKGFYSVTLFPAVILFILVLFDFLLNLILKKK